MESLNTLLADGVVEEVLGQLKTGKEAEVWLVRASGELVAAKIYKERHHRNFRNNADYKEGRQVRNTRTQRAMARGSRFGQQAAEDAWKAAESDALHTLHAAGVRVPKPVLFYEGVLLMEVVVDPEGHVAPRLVDAPLTREHALGLYETLRGEVVKMLCHDLVHGDLSEFNVLLAWNGPTIIDFPQVISAAHNSRAEHFFRRDLENLRRFFGGLDPAVAARHGDADEIWRAWTRRELTPDFVPTGRAAAPRREFVPGGPRAQRPGGGGRELRGGRPSPGRGPEVAYRGGAPAGGPRREGSGDSGRPDERGGGSAPSHPRDATQGESRHPRTEFRDRGHEAHGAGNGQRSDMGGQRGDVRGQRSDMGGQRGDVRGQRSDVRGQRGDMGGQRGDVRGQRGDMGGQRGDVRGQRSDMGGQRGDTGGQRGDMGGQRGDVRGQRGDVRGQRSDMGGQRGDTGGQRGDTGGQRGDVRGQRGGGEQRGAGGGQRGGGSEPRRDGGFRQGPQAPRGGERQPHGGHRRRPKRRF